MPAINNHLRERPKLVIVIAVILSISVILTVYYFQSAYFIDKPFWSNVIIAPAVLGVFIGIAFGSLINQYYTNERHHRLRQSLEKQRILNKILIKSKETTDLTTFLDGVLDIIINTSIAKINAEAGILLRGEDKRYRMVSQLNVNKDLLCKCAKDGILKGECLCGIAIEQNKIVYTDSIDDRHSIGGSEMIDHGHYVLPLSYKERVLGVLVFVLDKGHKYNKNEIEFLSSVADILALVINTYQSEQKERDSQIVISSAKRIAGLAKWQVVFPVRKANWSEELYRLLGYKREEVKLNKEFLNKIIHPDDLDRYLDLLNQAELGHPFETDMRLIDKKGRTKYVINKCTPNRGIDGKINRLTGVIFNITEIREKQEALIKQESFIKSIASDSPYSMFLLDIAQNKILFTNREFIKSVDPAIYKNLEENGLNAIESFIHPDDLALFRKTITEVLKANKEYYRLIGRFAYDGINYRWINQRFKPFKKNEDDKVTQVLLVAIDIEIQKAAEEKTKDLNDQLVLQNEKLQKLNHELDKFIYSASHDMRAPLASILGLLSLYKIDSELASKDLYIEHIESSIIKLDAFIHEIVDFTRNKETKLSPVKIKIVDFLNGIYTQLKYTNPTNKISFEVVSDRVKEITTDQERLGIIIHNILSNAIVYANTNLSSYIKCEVEISSSNHIIRIKDNGIGIDDQHIDKVFDMFHRASDKSKGSGLGLYIARETVGMLGGKLSITSKQYVGTEVIIQLPVIDKINKASTSI